jgi:hypothetical protein
MCLSTCDCDHPKGGPCRTPCGAVVLPFGDRTLWLPNAGIEIQRLPKSTGFHINAPKRGVVASRGLLLKFLKSEIGFARKFESGRTCG